MDDLIRQHLSASIATLEMVRARLVDQIAAAARTLIDCVTRGGAIFVFGNGGSAADAQHIAAELVGRFLRDRRPINAHALTTNSSTLTAVANDMGYDDVFSRQLRAHARPGDVAWAITTSGTSPNVIRALESAHELGLRSILLTGRGGGGCASLADLVLDVPSDHTPHIQEAHLAIYHVLCDLVERGIDGLEP